MGSDRPEIVIRYTLSDSGYSGVSAERITEHSVDTIELYPNRMTRVDLLQFAAEVIQTYKPKSLGVSIGGGPVQLISKQTIEDIAEGKRHFDDLLVG